MTDYVNLPNSAFDHDQLYLAPPNGLQGGAYFSMLYYKNAPLYIQTPKCTSRQGVTPGKRPYIDLMFSNHDVAFLEWLEALEANAVRLIYEKRNLWISSDIEKSEIEAGFTSPIRPYKGGKYYLIRAHIQTAKHLATGGSSSCSVFDENERPVQIDYIKQDHQMYAVIEFQGIKFTARSFQMEVNLKQVLIVPNVPLFQSCVIRRPAATVAAVADVAATVAKNPPIKEEEEANHDQEQASQQLAQLKEQPQQPQQPQQQQQLQPEQSQPEQSQQPQQPQPEQSQPEQSQPEQSQPEQSQPEQSQQPQQPDHLQEVHLDVLEELEHIPLKLKKPTQVYYEMYRIAKQKAKELKKNAIAAYLEAKQIKSTHMLEDSSDSNEEEDEEDEEDEEEDEEDEEEEEMA
jgi:hypothetical protein